MRSEDDFEEEYNEQPDGCIAKCISFTADDGKVMMTIEAADMHIEQTDDEESYDGIGIIGKVFKDVLKPGIRSAYKGKLNEEDIRVCIEIPKDMFTKEWKATLENSHGGMFKVTEDDPDKNVTKVIPQLNMPEDVEEKVKEENDE